MSPDKKVLRELDRYGSDGELTQIRTGIQPGKAMAVAMAAGGILLAVLFVVALFLRAAP
jgi:hypothetical protein